MSGHYATLLRGTVEAFLPTHDVYITDWADARMIPLASAVSISTITSIISRQMFEVLGPGAHSHRRVPAGGAADRRGRADGGGKSRRPSRFDDADGRSDRHAAQPDGGQSRSPSGAASNGFATIACIGCRFPIPASGGSSIPDSCNCRASWR